MSIETLLLLFVFVVLPLIEMFRTALQKRRQQTRPQPTPQQPVPVRRPSPVGKQTQTPPVPTRLPEVAPERPAYPDVPVLAAPDSSAMQGRQTMSHKIAAGRRLMRRQAVADALLDEAAGTNAGTIPTVIARLRSPGGLHGAMVVMAILGPCRAVDPRTPHQREESVRLPS